MKKRKSAKNKPVSSCSGAGYALSKSTSKGVRKTASRKLNACKKTKKKRR